MASFEKRKSNDGKTSYRVKVRLKGFPIQTATFERLTDAKKWAQKTEVEIRENRYFKTFEAQKRILGELVDRYIKTVLPQKSKLQRDQTTQLTWWREEIGEYRIAEITPALIADCRDKLLNEITRRKKKRTPATVTRYLAALSVAFSYAVNEWGWTQENPVQKVKKPTEPRGRIRFLSDEERMNLLQACKQSKNRFLYPAVILALSTGMRQGEILKLKWDDIDLSRKRAILHDTKNKERRSVPIVGQALEELENLAKCRRLDSMLVFPGTGPDKNKPIELRSSWNVALRRADIEDFRFHDLRHTAASYLAMNGATLAEIAEILGHKTLSMVKRYAHLSEAHTMDVVEKMNLKIFGG